MVTLKETQRRPAILSTMDSSLGVNPLGLWMVKEWVSPPENPGVFFNSMRHLENIVIDFPHAIFTIYAQEILWGNSYSSPLVF